MEQVMTNPVAKPKVSAQVQPQAKSKHTGWIIFGGLATLGIGVATWLIFLKRDENGNTTFQNWKNKNDAKDEDQQNQDVKNQQSQGVPAAPVMSGFPIQANTHNTNTKNLQNALMNVWGQKISGAPTDYLGKNTLAALKSVGYDAPVSQADYTNILAHKPKVSTSTNTASSVIGKGLWSQYGRTPVYKNDSRETLYKTAGAGEYIGKISGISGGTLFVSDGLYKVFNVGVIIK